jgi:hypothetical protein
MSLFWRIFVGVVVGILSLDVSRLFAMKLSYVGESPGWIYYLAPVVSALLLNPWFFHSRSRFPSRLFPKIVWRIASAVALVALVWLVVIWDVHSRVQTVRPSRKLSEEEVHNLYQQLHRPAAYDSQKNILYLPRNTDIPADFRALMTAD